MNTKQGNRTDNHIHNDHKSRKSDHLMLTEEAQVDLNLRDTRFYYEPALSGNNPSIAKNTQINFLGKTLLFPLWISSMTGGTKRALGINKNIAKACKQFGLGMGLGSCRQLLKDDLRIDDFNMRKICGDTVTLYANIGIGQLEVLINEGQLSLLKKLVLKLDADGLIIHINPMQEYFQPEGDLYCISPIDAISKLFDFFKDGELNIIVKEVGQGMGPKSLEALFKLPIRGFEMAAFGGTNFSKIEQLRSSCNLSESIKSDLINIGHTPEEMIQFINKLKKMGSTIPDIIISGGIKSAIEAFYYREICNTNCVYGLASRVLDHSLNEYEQLEKFLTLEIETFKICSNLLVVKKPEDQL